MKSKVEKGRDKEICRLLEKCKDNSKLDFISSKNFFVWYGWYWKDCTSCCTIHQSPSIPDPLIFWNSVYLFISSSLHFPFQFLFLFPLPFLIILILSNFPLSSLPHSLSSSLFHCPFPFPFPPSSLLSLIHLCTFLSLTSAMRPPRWNQKRWRRKLSN